MTMAMEPLAAGAALLACAAYLDARLHVRSDLRSGSHLVRHFLLKWYGAQKLAEGKMLTFTVFEDRAVGTVPAPPVVTENKTNDDDGSTSTTTTTVAFTANNAPPPPKSSRAHKPAAPVAVDPLAHNLFLIFESRSWTYAAFYHAVVPVANWLLRDLGVQKGEMVALDGTNSPEYLMLWLALEAVGARPAYINSNLTSAPLVHCVRLCGARWLLADEDVRALVEPVEGDLLSMGGDDDAEKGEGKTGGRGGAKVLYYNRQTFEALLDRTPLPRDRMVVSDPSEPASLIYTSGTTGMPKGTVMTRGRELGLPLAAGGIGLTPSDRMYTCLPLYHGAAHGLCVMPCIGAGAAVVLSRKFSHARFWPEVRASGATYLQYVGELCRYLVNAPPPSSQHEADLEKAHKVRVAWGNGMRPDVWERFRARFGIDTIHELYAATDGLLFTSNANRGDFSSNALGVRGPLWHLVNGYFETRVRIDPDSQEIVRDPVTGFASVVGADEPGEALVRMDPRDPDTGTPTYFGNHGAAVKRRARDVFRKGDLWFRTGDLMRLDAQGRLYFVDRLGDTFRWRSENVSTNEVSDVVGEWHQIAETNVYGVLVPHADGRAGCAAVVPLDNSGDDGGSGMIDWRGLAEHCLARLPRYAVPLFVRVVRQLEYTGTMKMQKGRLRGEGIDLEAIEKGARDKGEGDVVDALYWLPPGGREYVPFGRRELARLRGQEVRL